jgi:hypothetical protein
VARRYPGFLRAAITADADPRTHFSRRCWLSFERQGAKKIREICFALNNVPVKGFDLAPLVNKDLTRRIRPASDKLFAAEQIVRQDLAAACRIATFQAVCFCVCGCENVTYRYFPVRYRYFSMVI